jgi:hypothetical protein
MFKYIAGTLTPAPRKEIDYDINFLASRSRFIEIRQYK